MSKSVMLLGAGLVGGVALALGLQVALGEKEHAERSEVGGADLVVPQVAKLRDENERLTRELAEMTGHKESLERTLSEMEKEAAAPPTEAEPVARTGPVTEEQIQQEVSKLGSALGSIIRGGGEEQIKKFRAFVAEGGQPVIDYLKKNFDDESVDFMRRLVMAHAMAQSGDQGAVEALSATLLDSESGMIKHRLAAHGLAFTDVEGVDTILLRVANDDAEDIGARANASFGLARKGVEEGYAIYMEATDKAFENGDPAALQYLGGLTLLGEKSNPYIRERLLKYKDPQAVITLIEIVKSKKDLGAVPNLEKLAYNSKTPPAIIKAAEAALKVLRDK